MVCKYPCVCPFLDKPEEVLTVFLMLILSSMSLFLSLHYLILKIYLSKSKNTFVQREGKVELNFCFISLLPYFLCCILNYSHTFDFRISKQWRLRDSLPIWEHNFLLANMSPRDVECNTYCVILERIFAAQLFKC